MKKVIFDTETVGLNPQKDKIVEIGMIEIDEQNKWTGNFFHSYVNPKQRIPRIITKINGINWHTIKDAPTFGEIKSSVLDFIQDKELISHYMSFNLRMLQYALGIDLENKTTDTLLLTRKALPKQNEALPMLVKSLKLRKNKIFSNPLMQDCCYIWQLYTKLIETLSHTNQQV